MHTASKFDAPLYSATHPSRLTGDGTLNPYFYDVRRTPSSVVPTTHVRQQHNTSGNVNPVVRSLQMGKTARNVLPASALPSQDTPQLAMEVLHAAQTAPALRFTRGGPFVRAVTNDDPTEYTRVHSVAGHALHVSVGPMLSDIAVELGALPPGEPVPYPHPTTGEPTLYLCSYLGAALTKLWLQHVPSLVYPVGARSHDVHRIIAASFRNMLAAAHGRLSADHRYDAQYEFRRDHPFLAQRYKHTDRQYMHNKQLAARATTRTVRDRLGALSPSIGPPKQLTHLYKPPPQTVFSRVPLGSDYDGRNYRTTGERILTYNNAKQQ